ncbi:Efflux pump aflT [Colletotrichum trifolii]|uniref:Efflux pump aflT n=1 Tax=Colletotrichum trifolii TaxID=5466 RepID=A0A4R8QDW2_COLTR|nr:Efflux pump aflT [Colletotrichum trifolii]
MRLALENSTATPGSVFAQTMATDRVASPRASSEEAKGPVEPIPVHDPTAEVYPDGPSLAAITAGLFLAILCLGLDRSILATAIPKITTDFNSLPDVAWYGSAYLFTQCSFQLLFGKLYAEYNIKWIFLGALGVFEVGSVVCAAAPDSVSLIVGRAVSGVGAAGLMSGALIIIARSVPLHKRPTYTAAVGAAAGISQCVAPTLGGVFVDKATWRWCFWINLPLGGITFFVILLFFKLPVAAKKQPMNMKQFVQNFDLIGTLLLIPWVICLLLALQWGGTVYAWGSWRIILCWCVFAICFLVWGFVQYSKGDGATVPFRIMAQRSMICACWLMLLLFSLLFINVYYMPIWLQAVKNHSAYQSGIDLLASSAPLSAATILSGALFIASSVIVSVAGGLMYTFAVDTSTVFWAASLVLMGIGVGLGGQQTIIAAQTVFQGRDVALATSLLVFLQSLGGTVFLAVAQNMFHSRLISDLHHRVPNKAGASGLLDSMRNVYPDSADDIITAYSKALQNVFLISAVLGCLTIFGAVFMEWKSVNENKPGKAIKGEEKSTSGQLEG